MSDKIQFYYSPISRAVVVHWMLEELGVPYDIHFMDIVANDTRKPEFLAINPMGKLPTIVHQGTVITEGAAICAYLADAFPKANLAPKFDDPTRGTYLRWLFFAASCIEPAVMDHAYPRKESVPSSTLGYGSYKATIDTLEHAVSKGPYILGSNFSAADVYIGSMLDYFLMIKGIEPRPAFMQYQARMHDRPAYHRFQKSAGSFMAKV